MNIEIIILSMVEEYKWSNGYKVKEGEKVFSIESTNFFFTSKTTYPKNYQRLLNSYGVNFDSSIPFIVFQNKSIIEFYKKSFRIVKSKIDKIDIDFISLNERVL